MAPSHERLSREVQAVAWTVPMFTCWQGVRGNRPQLAGPGTAAQGGFRAPPSLKLLGVSGGKPQVRCSTHPIACTGGQEEDQGGGCPGGLAIWDTPLDRTEENGRTGVDAACRAGTPGAAESQKEEGTAQEALERPPRGPF